MNNIHLSIRGGRKAIVRAAMLAIFVFSLTGLTNAYANVVPAKGRLVAAKPGRCLLQIDGKKYITGRCDITFIEKGTGSFQIEETRKDGYFAQVLIGDDAQGYWNGERGATHAHSSLGTLTKNGACWENDTAKICAWR